LLFISFSSGVKVGASFSLVVFATTLRRKEVRLAHFSYAMQAFDFELWMPGWPELKP